MLRFEAIRASAATVIGSGCLEPVANISGQERNDPVLKENNAASEFASELHDMVFVASREKGVILLSCCVAYII